MPSLVQFENGSRISYLYDANGVKLHTTHVVGGVTTTTDYCGSVVYDNGVAKTLLTEAGYVSLSDGKYHYYLQDHQGNNCVVIDQTGAIEEINQYDPFGALMSTDIIENDIQSYKYNSKELNRAIRLDWYDYRARQYDAILGRWHAMDPMAERKYYSWSPYAYCLGNPVNMVDPDGKQVRPVRPPVRRGYRNGGRPNPYAFYSGGVKPQNYRETRSFAYSGSGLRKQVSVGEQGYLLTVNTPGGNEVQMSKGNKLGRFLSGEIDLTDNIGEIKKMMINLVTEVKYTETGLIQRSTNFVIDDPNLARQQNIYDARAAQLDKEMGTLDYSGKSLMEILEMSSERKKAIQDKLGLSPRDVLQDELMKNPGSFQSIGNRREAMQEFRQN